MPEFQFNTYSGSMKIAAATREQALEMLKADGHRERPSELQAFLAMLTRANIGHGTRQDFNPPGTGVQVECEFGKETDWRFDESGKLIEVYVSDT